jgi:hypothetical protein
VENSSSDVASPAKWMRGSTGVREHRTGAVLAGQGVAVAAEDMRFAAPGRSGDEAQLLAPVASQQRGKLPKRELGGAVQAFLLHRPRAFAAEHAFDQRTAEGLERVGAGAGAVRVAEQMGVVVHILGAFEREEQLVGQAERQLRCGVEDRIMAGQLDGAAGQHVRRDGNDHGIGGDRAARGFDAKLLARSIDCPHWRRQCHRQCCRVRGDQRAIAVANPPVDVERGFLIGLPVDHRHLSHRGAVDEAG